MNLIAEIEQVRQQADLLYSAAEVDSAIERMAEQIRSTLSEANPLCLCVLNGGIVLTGKLLPLLSFPLTLDTVHATRYRGDTSGHEIHWLHAPQEPLQNRNVLVLDDILDHGITLAAIRDVCLEKGARSVHCAVLVDKQLAVEKPVRADFTALPSEDRYLFGYGMDYKGYLRNAPGIYACRPTPDEA